MTFFLGRREDVFTHPRQEMGHSKNITKVQLGELIIFIGATYRHIAEGLFTGAEMAQRQMNHQSWP